MPKHTKGSAGEAQETPNPTPDGAGAKRTATAAGAINGATAIARGRPVAERKKKYLVAPRATLTGAFGASSWVAPLGLSAVQQALRTLPDIDVVDTIATRGGMAPAGFGPAAMGEPADGVVVARMTDQKARELLQRGQGQLLVERDQHLELLDPMLRRPDLVSSLTPYHGPQAELLLVVVGKDGAPLPDVEVSLFGGALPSSAVTGADGVARLRLYGEDAHTISGLYVKPRTDYWSLYQRDPDLSVDEPNLVMLRPLADWPALRGMPQQSAMGWGARAMRLDQVPQQFRGRGIKIAVIDSGAATTHGNLNQIHAGFDVVNKTINRSTWNVDTLGHGSHCAGVIAAADPAWGIRGFAPEAEIHICKLFPGGQVSQLIDALEYCIEQGIDVVNLSLGGGSPSEALEWQIVRAKQAGVACIAAAGNSAAAVQYPASSPHVLAVAAIGKIGEFPPDSYHAETIGPDGDMQGYFTARFSCFGPQIDVCAPGVAVVSSVPPNNFAAWDGTSMAAPHVTGLAALVLAHRPEFQSMSLPRSPERVERLFQVLRMSARPVTLGDANRIGYGLPDALVALGLTMAQSSMAWQGAAASVGIPAGMFATSPGDGARLGMGPAGGGGQVGTMQYPFAGLRPSGW
ncbi:S8 family serine peptidase [Massilia oculi]|uniref:Subtilisin n=1 Tax=Massilia oculi TaxID=945844 RepID=A0A2S2DNG8_9BURK|nr:S8 family serine peptidase [Massilia oculi]AWL06894.1 subtilisin [Massilia oculi]